MSGELGAPGVEGPPASPRSDSHPSTIPSPLRAAGEGVLNLNGLSADGSNEPAPKRAKLEQGDPLLDEEPVPEIDSSLRAQIEAANANMSQQSLEKKLGVPLGEATYANFETWMLADLEKSRRRGDEGDKGDIGNEGLSANEKKQNNLLDKAVDEGSFCTKSGLGNRFRADHKKGTPEGDAYALLSRGEAATFRLQWAQGELQKLDEKRQHSQSWKRVDRTKGRYRPFGRLVIDFGGWGDKAAVQGAATAASKCMMMGAPWVHRHPQTNLLEYLVLEIEWEEEFSQAWGTFNDYIVGEGEHAEGRQQHRKGKAQGQGEVGSIKCC